jgi:excisionase family DNA binding protein
MYSALEVANICGVVNQTAINWIRNGHLKAFTTPGGQYRVHEEDLSSFLVKRGMSNSADALRAGIEGRSGVTTGVSAGDEQEVVLIIDHDYDANNRLKGQLEHMFPGFEIRQAYDGFEAGQQLYQSKPGLVFLNVALPGINVFNLAKKFKEDPALGNPNIFVLMQDEGEGIRQVCWADACFPQPVDPDKLWNVIRGLDRRITVTA